MAMSPEQANNLFSHFKEGVNTMDEVVYLGHLINQHEALAEYFYSDRHVTQEAAEAPTADYELPQAS